MPPLFFFGFAILITFTCVYKLCRHLPADVVLTEKAYTSILAAIEDSCDVYGELNTLDTNVTSVIEACATPVILNSATLLDIPDEQLQDELRAKLLEVISTYIEPNMEVAQVIASRLEPLPLAEIQRMILYANTPEYMANHSVSIYTDTGAPSLDVNMLLLGRPADDIEEPEDQCELLPVLYPSADVYKAGFAMDPEAFSQDIRDSLDLSLSNEIEMYKCGDIDAFVAANTDGAMFLDEVTNDVAITIRNQNMAKMIVEVLADNQNERVLFAVGAAHWQIGNDNFDSLETLLLKDGYSLEHVPDYHPSDTENHDNDHCDVIFNPETGIFDVDPDDDTVPSPMITSQPVHSVILTDDDTDDGVDPSEIVDTTETVEEETTPTATPPADDPSPTPPVGVPSNVEAPTSSSTMNSASFLLGAAGFIYLFSCM